jgi:hypothetical protein
MTPATRQRNSKLLFMPLMIAKDLLEGKEDCGPDQNL